MFKNIIKLSLISSLLVSTILYADDGFEDDAFTEESRAFSSDEVIEIVKVQEDKSKFSAYGSLSLSASYNYAHHKPEEGQNDFRGLSSSKLSTDINLEYKLDNDFKIKSTLKAYKDFIYDLKDDEYITTPYDYDKDAQINELYLQGSINSKTDIKIGRQIVVWGKSDNIRITDTLNPMDNTTPGMIDIEDLRLARTMSKLDYFINEWAISGIVLHENRYSEMPQYGSDFASSNQIQADMMSTKEPSNSLKDAGIALSASANLRGQDIAFYYSNQYVDNTIYRSNMLGMAYNKVLDSFLFKTEFAYFINQCDKSQCDNYDSSTIKSKLDGLVGLEYNGISDGSISFEMANKNYDIQYALRFTQSYINQTLDFTALYSAFGKNLEDGGFVRVWIDYDIDDKLSTSFGVINYIGGDVAQFEMIKDNDRVFASLKYSF
ncbi:MAG: DUF1302 family protein [Campylobacterota bacterium]|nr:DUF1302 family protein [Campylobacterota bacterium]